MLTDECVLQVKVIPKTRHNKIVGWENEVLKVHLTAAPEKGEANHALVQLLAKVLHVPKSSIELLQGETSRQKKLRIVGITKEKVLELLEKEIFPQNGSGPIYTQSS